MERAVIEIDETELAEWQGKAEVAGVSLSHWITLQCSSRRACKACGKIFSKAWPTQLYCNKKCLALGPRKHIICMCCGRNVTDLDRRSRFCRHPDCVRSRVLKRQETTKVLRRKCPEMTCHLCNSTFTRTHSAQKFCSRSCRLKHSRRYQKARYQSRFNPIQTPCKYCGHLFAKEKYWQKYCNERCRKNAEKKRTIDRNESARLAMEILELSQMAKGINSAQ